jgi:hypothetical protein
MLRKVLIASLVAATVPAFAQTTGEVSDTAGMTPPATTQADPGTITVENTPEQQALAERAVPEVAATEGEVKLAVDTEWFKFDRDRNGALDQDEFGRMLRKFRKAAAAALKDGPQDAARANAAAFAVADVDKNGSVNRDEFVGLLQSPAA